MKEIDNFYLQKEEPAKSCLMALRQIILDRDRNISEAWKYRMPFFCYKGKMFCYLWVEKKTGLPYLGIVEGNKIAHPGLIQDERSRMKIMRFDPSGDLPLETIHDILDCAISLYTSGLIKLK
ncbi:DUF1801 domain-containing protein [Dyadobacter frigoris]|uniref:DUF1801 domain-containing protein n=1 Tax=Dyadobacter frigoris TaxID=2576211 RepID=A0A4U6D2N3_9BACT|nr:DUF1801 domain-containing protein [Dyadobacter frigoris]TKT90118.1 DUF1801 domain-containing protein [Dyadobacter frigoris]GLU52345.1 hypothetical protein Dfri01_18060 [Dyadobacter frigoris]